MKWQMPDLTTKMGGMDLPIFSDNLKSSAAWTAGLDRERESWERTRRQSRERVEELIREQQVLHAVERAGRAGQGIGQSSLIDAARQVTCWASQADIELSAGRLIELHRLLTGAADAEELLRKTELSPINRMHDPTPAILAPRMLDLAFDWFTAPSFGQLHPVEQASVVYLRLLDIHPFTVQTETSALLAAGYYTQRADLPPLIVFADQATLERYEQSLDAAFRMLTQPLVEFFAEMLIRAMQVVTGQIGAGNER